MEFKIEHFDWGQDGEFPVVLGSLTSDGRRLMIHFDIFEEELRAVHSQHNGMVCEDSCAEFFFCPYADDPRYINIEVNPIGTVHMAVGEGRHNRVMLPVSRINAMDVRTTVYRGGARSHWGLTFSLPYCMVAEIYNREPIAQGDTIRCNMYKCGDKLSKPHWGSWNPIGTERPDFHRPEYFTEVAI